jgi:hypothetical protein
MSQALVSYTVDDMKTMALALSGSKLFGISTPDQALALCLVAQAEGRHPASAAQDYHVIQGRPSKKADAMLRDFLASKGTVEWHALTDELADATFSHPAGGSVRISWDMARVKKAGISNAAMYAKFPRQMLRSRTVSEGVRTVFPMATSGMYVPEEVEDIAAEKSSANVIDRNPPNETPNTPMIEGEVVGDPKSAYRARKDGDWEALTNEIDACADIQALEILVHSRPFQDVAKKMPKSWVELMGEYIDKARAKLTPSEADPEPVPPNFDALETEGAPA